MGENSENKLTLLESVSFVFYRCMGRVQSTIMALRFSSGEVASVVTGLTLLAVDVFIGIGDSSSAETIQFIGLAAIFAVLIPLIKVLAGFRRSWSKYNIQSSRCYHDETLKKLRLPETYIQNGYAIREFVDGNEKELYVSSDSIDQMLYEDSVCKDGNINVWLNKYSYQIPDEVKALVHEVFTRYFHKNKESRIRMYNGRLFRQVSDLYLADSSKHEVELQKVRYFDGECTNELAFKRVPNASSISVNFHGETLLLSEKSEMFELWESRCANYIGASTLAITTDNYIILGYQERGSAVNVLHYVPSGSGSINQKDFKNLCSQGRGNSISLGALIKFAAEREFREECRLERSCKIKSDVIGYARLLERGGKPDFFCISHINKSWNEVKKANEKAGLMLSEIEISGAIEGYLIGEGESVSQALEGALNSIREKNGNDHCVSTQLDIMLREIKAHEKRGIVFKQ